ncbi:AP-1-like transcription factor [Entomortierella parvispora]|uniref:AP-1-like transcription factor n=1 Tax=Entomortierella parvispora TaxID=205924 RepID=A0A9P3HK04_9FUNG|nr:AP-1-like transcription factor [Entomortierella parvispora]
MTSTMRHAPQQFRIIQQEFGRKDKRPCPSNRQTGKAQASTRDDDEEAFEDEQDGNSSHSTDNATGENKGRKKPGRKPNPASPAVRKEQNRAAQRAFRDRKERHLQEMETTIKTLKETNEQSVAQSQQLKSTIDTLQSENFYLREVVFSFENALSKTGNAVILQEVKAELYRRHYEKHSTRKIDNPTPPSVTTAAAAGNVSATTSGAPSSSFQLSFIPTRIGGGATASTTNGFDNAANTHSHTSTRPLDEPMTAVLTPAVHTTCRTGSAIPPMPGMNTPTPGSANTVSSWQRSSHLSDLPMFSMNSEILYKAPPMFGQPHFHAPDRRILESAAAPLEYERQNRDSPMEQSQPKSTVDEGGLASTVYSGHVSVFDELQSSLFPPGTLQSIIHTSLATPQEIVNDIPLLDQLHDPRSSPHKDPLIAPSQNTAHFQFDSSTPSSTPSTGASSSPFPDSSSSFLDDDEINEFRMSTPTLGLDDGLKQEVIPSYRLQLEIRVLASAPPAVDPNIDPKIYALPHDSRIDLIPCPKLRAQMILQQNRYHIEELCDLLIAEAKCHGHPLDPHSWELPDAFFDRYGFLLGEEMLRHRNKIWPKKDEPLQEVSRAH